MKSLFFGIVSLSITVLLGYSSSVLAASSLAYCPPTIYCPDSNAADCLIPVKWKYAGGNIGHSGSVAFSYASQQTASSGSCTYFPMNIKPNNNTAVTAALIILYNGYASAAVNAPDNKWIAGRCDSPLYPAACPFETIQWK